jgi:DNA-binding transcriptional ArsR family regulator
MSSNDLDLDDLKLLPETARDRAVGFPNRLKKRRRQFVQLPLAWVDLLARNSRNKTFAVLCHLVHLTWKQGGGPVKVPNGFLEMLGVKPDAKSYALNKLENLGIISVERRDYKSPIVTINDKSDAADEIADIDIGKGSPESRRLGVTGGERK